MQCMLQIQMFSKKCHSPMITFYSLNSNSRFGFVVGVWSVSSSGGAVASCSDFTVNVDALAAVDTTATITTND